MRNATYSLSLTLPNNDVLVAMFPISKGPYSGHDLLMVMNDLCGMRYVVRATLDGKHLSTSPKIKEAAVKDLLAQMLLDQSNSDCGAVTGNGRWSCD